LYFLVNGDCPFLSLAFSLAHLACSEFTFK
jgi:hypothetical protein